LDANGQHAYTLYSLPPGFYTLTGTYSPAGSFSPSTGTATLHVVASGGGGGPASTAVTITVPPQITVNDTSARAVVSGTSTDGSHRVPTGTIGLVFSGFLKVERLPWAEGKSHLTTTYQWFLARWAKRLSWQQTAKGFRTSWENVY